MNRSVYVPIWPDRDPVSETALKAVGFAIFMAAVCGAAQFLEIVW